MDAARFGALTAIGTVGFYGGVTAVVFWGRRRGLYAAVYASATNRPWLTGAVVLFVVSVAGLLIRMRSRWG